MISIISRSRILRLSIYELTKEMNTSILYLMSFLFYLLSSKSYNLPKVSSLLKNIFQGVIESLVFLNNIHIKIWLTNE